MKSLRAFFLIGFALPVFAYAPPQTSIYIRANQVGYHINGTKIAIAFSEEPLPADFRLVGEKK